MNEEKIELANLDTTIYKYTFDNGLIAYLIPYENKNNYYMHYVTRFGSVDTSFVPYGEEEIIKVPDGIAHFLEHKMFEVEDGLNPFEFSSLSGTNCNASTYYKYTRYLFEGNKNFKDNLDYLFTYVHTPYFTDENVEKEKGIIKEELLQYKDMVDVEMDNIVLESVFNKDPMRIDIGGTVDSIMKITKEDLYKTYNTFYQPSNMFLVVSGNFNIDNVIDVIKNNKSLNNAKTNFDIKRLEIEEDLEICKNKVDVKLNTSNIRVNYSIKVPISDYKGLDRYKYVTYFGMMLSITFGSASTFREKMKKEEKMTSFYYERIYTDDYMVISFTAQSDRPEEFVEDLKNEFGNMKFTEEDVGRVKKVWISSEVIMSDDPDLTLDNIVYDVIEYGDIIPNKVDIYKKMNLTELKNVVNNIDYNNSTTVIVRPAEIK